MYFVTRYIIVHFFKFLHSFIHFLVSFCFFVSLFKHFSSSSSLKLAQVKKRCMCWAKLRVFFLSSFMLSSMYSFNFLSSYFTTYLTVLFKICYFIFITSSFAVFYQYVFNFCQTTTLLLRDEISKKLSWVLLDSILVLDKPGILYVIYAYEKLHEKLPGNIHMCYSI